MSSYLDQFPLVRYDIDRNQLTENKLVTNIFFRMDIIASILDNIAAYELYFVKDGEKPEHLAERYYGTPEAHWLILYANKITDPQYEWPRSGSAMASYLFKKYKDDFRAANPNYKQPTKKKAYMRDIVSWLQTQPHSYYKVVTLVNGPLKEPPEYIKEHDEEGNEVIVNNIDPADVYTTVRRYPIDKEPLSNVDPLDNGFVYETYQANTSFLGLTTDLPGQQFNTYQIGNRMLTETITKEMKSIYDHEMDINESNRAIKIIKSTYYPQIATEFEKLTGKLTAASSYVRRLA